MKNALVRRASELEHSKNIAAVIALPPRLEPRRAAPANRTRLIDAGASRRQANLDSGGSWVACLPPRARSNEHCEHSALPTNSIIRLDFNFEKLYITRAFDSFLNATLSNYGNSILS